MLRVAVCTLLASMVVCALGADLSRDNANGLAMTNVEDLTNQMGKATAALVQQASKAQPTVQGPEVSRLPAASSLVVAAQSLAATLEAATPADATSPAGLQGFGGSRVFGSFQVFSDGACNTQTELTYFQSGTCIQGSTNSQMMTFVTGGINSCTFTDSKCTQGQNCQVVASGACAGGGGGSTMVNGPVAGAYAEVTSWSGSTNCQGQQLGPFYLLYGTCTTLGQFSPPQYCIPCPGGTCLNVAQACIGGGSSSFLVRWNNAAAVVGPNTALLALLVLLVATALALA